MGSWRKLCMLWSQRVFSKRSGLNRWLWFNFVIIDGLKRGWIFFGFRKILLNILLLLRLYGRYHRLCYFLVMLIELWNFSFCLKIMLFELLFFYNILLMFLMIYLFTFNLFFILIWFFYLLFFLSMTQFYFLYNLFYFIALLFGFFSFFYYIRKLLIRCI